MLVESLMEEQLAEMRELDVLSRRMEAIVDGDVDEVFVLLAERAELLGRLGERGAAIGAGGADSARAAHLRASLVALGEDIHERDERSLALLTERRDGARRELGEIGRSRDAVRAYGGSGGARARFRDDRA